MNIALKSVIPLKCLDLSEIKSLMPDVYLKMLRNRSMMTYVVTTRYGSKDDSFDGITDELFQFCNNSCEEFWTFRSGKVEKSATQDEYGQWTTIEHLNVEVMFESKSDQETYLKKFALIQKLAT